MPTVEIRMDVTGIPHSFIVIDNGAGVVQTYGFAPAAPGHLWGEGRVYNDSTHPFDVSTGPIELTVEQYNQVVQEINNAIANPPYYDLPVSFSAPYAVNQCATWVSHLAQIGGFSNELPWPRGGGWNPWGQAIWTKFGVLKGSIRDFYLQAQKFVPRRDPLTFDLDGDGIETVAASTTNPILFDHDGDGIKNGTGWVNSDDAFLVLDKNGNGTIDNGNELFGDSTIKSNGQKAVDGFDALADLDSNHDGVVNAQDSQFANLRLWRDLNQDGISQSNELFTLDSQNIAGINVASTEHSQVLANGNELADKGTFIKADGSTGSFGEVTGNIGDVNLADDTFNREFPDHLDTSGLPDLPDMQGRGKVRDLLEAATQSTRLQSLLQDFSAATTRAGQMAIIDSLLDAWADTSGMAESLDDRVEGIKYEAWTFNGIEYVRSPTQDLPYNVVYQAFGSQQRQYVGSTIINNGGGGGGGTLTVGTIVKDLDNENLTESYKALIAEWQQKIHILEAFNGSYFFGLPTTTQPEGAKSGLTFISGSGSQSSGGFGGIMTSVPMTVSYTQQQLDFLNNSYVSLKESVFDALVLQTRIKPILDQVSIVIDDSGMNLDFSQVNSYFQNKIEQNLVSGLESLLEFNQVTSSLLINTGWTGNQMVANYIRSATITPQLQEVFNAFRVQFSTVATTNGSAFDDFILGDQSVNSISGGDGDDRIFAGEGNDSLNGGLGNDVLVGEQGNDNLYGNQGDDYLDGGDGDDWLYGNEGTDVLIGGAGNDRIYADTSDSISTSRVTADDITGGLGNDLIYGSGGANIYRYNLGDGTDTISASGWQGYVQSQAATAILDTLVLGEGISRTDVTFGRSGDYDFVINFANAGDKITFTNWYYFTANRLASIQFADGSTMGASDFLKLQGSNANDTIRGSSDNDVTYGLGGNDNLYGNQGDDYLDGGDGDDWLYGNEGTDVLIGGAGNDRIYADTSDSISTSRVTADDITGGLGNDLIYGSGGANIYRYNLGDGTDTISASGWQGYVQSQAATAILDTLVLGEGISRTDVTFGRSGDYDFVINFANAGDKITFTNWYYFTANRLASIQFADGSTMGASDFLKLQGSNANDTIRGSSDNDIVYGLDGNDSLYGNQGDDYLDGGDGDDWLYGDEGADVLIGGAGNDIIFGHSNSSISTEITTADDITGGLGNDSIYGTGGANIYRYNLGDGTDTIEASGRQDWSKPATTTLDTLILGTGISRTDLTFSKSGDFDFVITFTNAGDKITFRNWYAYAGSRLASIQFADGSTMGASDLLAIKGTNNNDSVTGTADNDIVYGLGGNDNLYGRQGDDYLDGGDGNDWLYGDEGTDVLIGGAGNDIIYGHSNSSISTEITTADDITGGLGNDSIYGTGGANIYRYNLGDGTDTVEASGRQDWSTPATTIVDSLILGTGISRTDLTFSKSGDFDFVITFTNAGDKITFRNWYAYAGSRLASIQFADGSTMGASDFLRLQGTNLNDSVRASSDNDIVYGLDGNDSLYGNQGDDYLDGGEGADWLYGDEGTDVLVGGAGNDIIYASNTNASIAVGSNTADDITGGLGNDTIYGTGGANIYRYNLGDGTDTIEASGRTDYYSYPTTATLDTLILGTGISHTDVTFTKSSNDFIINFSNAGDKITFRNWYAFTGSRLASIQFADGSTMDASDFVTLHGTTGNDSITASVDNDIVYGLDGNDNLYGGQGDDYLDGGEGADWLYGDEGTDVLVGGAGNDIIYASNTNASIAVGSNTADDITGGLGNDTIYGTGGANIYRYNLGDGTDTIEASGRTDYYSYPTTATLDTLILGTGISHTDVTFTKSSNDFIINFSNAGDKITFRNWYAFTGSRLATIQFADDVTYSFVQGNIGTSLNDIIAGGSTAVAETMVGGAGDDIYLVDHASDVVTEGLDEGNDRVISSVTYTLSNNVENLQLVGSANINASGNSLSNVIIGNNGNNILDGQGGSDIMQGGLGDDTYVLDTELDQFIEAANEGNDTVKITYSNTGSLIDFTLGAGQYLNIENITVQGSGLFNLYGSSANNSLVGNSSSNLIVGYDGDDMLDGGLGSDVLIGGTGNDQYYIDNIDDVVTELESEGIDTVNSSITYSIADKNYIENITLIGSSAINATGNDGDNVLTGNAAVNQLTGGKGNDTYVVAATDDVITELANEGVDTVASSVTFSLANYANIENLTLTGSSSINGTGNSQNNIIIGNISSNILNGGSGDDLMLGGLGSDTYYVDSYSDQIIENLNEGSDTVNVSITTAGGNYVLGANLENATLINTVTFNLTGNELNNSLTGNSNANTLIGGAGNDILNGGAGADALIGGAGDDVYYVDNVGDTVDEAFNEGTDLVYVSIATAGLTYTVANNVENVTLQNGVAFNITGNELNNVLIGNGAANTLNGGLGNDTLNGGAGGDILIGGAGDDIYYVDSLADVVTELENEGIDTVNVSISTSNGSYSLGDNIENAVITSSQNYSLIGNALNNSLTGNSWNNTLNGGLGDDVLNGGAGVDTLIGGDGNDIYIVDTTTDTITELVDGGTDTVQSSVSFVLASSSNLENLTLTGSSSINGTGNELTNFLLGNTGSNTLADTVGGNDVLQGLAGNDTLNDTVGNNLLDGGAGTDVITAGSGSDLIIGGTSNDTITTGTGYDVILFNKGDGADIINASVGTDNTLSLGGNFAYSDLSLSKSSNDLILKMGTSDQITFKGWYDTSANNKSVLNLQVIAEATQGFSLGGSDTLRDNKVETFNFANLVAAFDAAGTTANWQLTDARLTAHLSAGSDAAAIGGDIAYQYGKAGSLTGVGLLAAQAVMNNASVGQTAQTLNASSSWAAETIKLS